MVLKAANFAAAERFLGSKFSVRSRPIREDGSALFSRYHFCDCGGIRDPGACGTLPLISGAPSMPVDALYDLPEHDIHCGRVIAVYTVRKVAMLPFRAFAALSVLYTVLVCYYSYFTGMRFYGAGGTLLTLGLIPPGLIFARPRGVLSWRTLTGKIGLIFVAAMIIFCLLGIVLTIAQYPLFQ